MLWEYKQNIDFLYIYSENSPWRTFCRIVFDRLEWNDTPYVKFSIYILNRIYDLSRTSSNYMIIAKPTNAQTRSLYRLFFVHLIPVCWDHLRFCFQVKNSSNWRIMLKSFSSRCLFIQMRHNFSRQWIISVIRWLLSAVIHGIFDHVESHEE